MNIITDVSLLQTPAEPLVFLTENGTETEEGNDIITKIKETLESNDGVIALSAQQIGINKRIFGIKFDNTIKFFINPIITKKSGMTVSPETFSSMPGKEILIGRPDEITIVYYNDEFKYEDNKLIGGAARVFDQMSQLLDGVTPDELGLVSDVEIDGSLSDLTEEEMNQVTEMWKSYVKTKLSAMESSIKNDDDLAKHYTSLKFTESVINGRTTVVDDSQPKPMNRAQRRASDKIAKRIAKNTRSN